MYKRKKIFSFCVSQEERTGMTKFKKFFFFWCVIYVLASVGILHTLVVTVEEFSIKELDGNDGKDEVEEEVHNQDVEHILQRVDHTVKHGLHTHISREKQVRKVETIWFGCGKKNVFY